MYAIKAVYDGENFKPKEPIPVNEEYEVVITFTTPINNLSREKKFSNREKNKIKKSLYGILPPDIDLEKSRMERLS
ncbi:MAG: hypothetical protein FWD78_15165 [Treponema sp.]|nr:hypothetical protein [Treponema sp.]